MGLRFRKSIKIAPGVKLNFNKSGSGVTLGSGVSHYTINSKGAHTKTVSIPGTGISYVSTSEKKSSKKTSSSSLVSTSNARRKKNKGGCLTPFLIGFGLLAVFSFFSPDSENETSNSAQTETEFITETSSLSETATEPITEVLVTEETEELSEVVFVSELVTESELITEFNSDSESVSLTETTMYATSSLNVRCDRGTGSEILGKLSAGDPVSVTSIDDGWAAIIYNGVSAYVASNYLSNSQPETEPPAVMVWLPESGSKYHRTKSCSNMDNPRQATIDEAKNLGYEACKRCH